ncbi:hypothetical protein IC235_10865 [Hymenobacter sp. BT664]|uniref:Uncharacterized protein n=1 Tax=Hymenobacter montanus TaxID=2771359 RepID=A0A927BDY2_9BACT|nr:hypothetical protein [Hymenobacter montanus]MBD2768394.1 hypothetical protein [Hymenobacter montanus]
MPKLIDYPRTTYASAWELAEVIDDTGGKCAIETAARKLNRKVSGSFKAIIGSAVKFGLLTSKRDLLTSTTLFKRIKHAYDKQEELVFHREAFLTPPLFTQLCRKFRSRELPVQMLDVMLIREFGVEEINAQGVAKAFVEGCRMVGLLDERNIIADIDALAAQQSPRRELASPQPTVNTFRKEPIELTSGSAGITPSIAATSLTSPELNPTLAPGPLTSSTLRPPATPTSQPGNSDAIASLFGLLGDIPKSAEPESSQPEPKALTQPETVTKPPAPVTSAPLPTPTQAVTPPLAPLPTTPAYQIQVSGPGVNTTLSITEEEDISIALALLEKIRRQLKA